MTLPPRMRGLPCESRACIVRALGEGLPRCSALPAKWQVAGEPLLTCRACRGRPGNECRQCSTTGMVCAEHDGGW